MSKITAEHLARSAIVYVRQSTAIRLQTTLRANGVNMASSSADTNSVGLTFK
jgi:hypothetical protein